MLAADVSKAENLLNRLGLLNESKLIVKVQGIAEINIRARAGWRWIGGIKVDRNRFLALMQIEINDCLEQLAAIGVEVPDGDPDAAVAAIKDWV